MQEPDPVKALIKKVGRGKTLARDLTSPEAFEAIERLLGGQFTPAQTGAFLQALRIKETTVDELVGAAQGAAGFCPEGLSAQPPANQTPLVVNLAFDTARKGGVLSLAALAYLKSEGLVAPLVVWEPASLFDQPSALARTLAAIQSHPKLAKSLPEMVTIRQCCPPWEALSPLRKELGFRSILNTIEKLLRPWPTAPVVVGISHDTFSERLCHVLNALGASSGAVVRGHHGTCDLGFGEKPTSFHSWNGDQVHEDSVEAHQLPWPAESSALLVSSLDSWAEWMTDETSGLWGMIRSQAAFFVSVATQKSLAESIQMVQKWSTEE